MDEIISIFFSSFIKLFALLTPPAVLSTFLSGTKNYRLQRKRRTIVYTIVTVFIMGFIFYSYGDVIFNIFGFTLDGFRIGAGTLLFLSAVSLMHNQDEKLSKEHEEIGIVPLAIPICMGPATIGMLVVMGASSTTFIQKLTMIFALLVAVLLIGLMLFLAEHIQKILGETGIIILSKFTGLLLSAIAAQVVFTGIKNFLVING